MSDIDNVLRQIKPRVSSWIARDIAAAATISGGVKDHGALTGLGDDDHTQYVHISTARQISAQHTFAPTSPAAPFALNANAQDQLVSGLLADGVNKSVTAGAGLSGGGSLATSSVTLDVGSGTLITVNADNISLSSGAAQYQVPLTGSSPFVPAWTTTSSNPGAAVAVLRTDTSGFLNLLRLNVDVLADRSGGNLTISPAGDITLDPAGNDVLPYLNYDINLGTINKKYLTIHAAELWVETLVAQNTIATIGGRILVAPTTVLVSDLSASQTQLCLNPGFEDAGGGGSDIFADWTENAGTGSITQASDGPHGGTYYCKLTAGISYDTYVYQDFSVAEGQGYTLSFWCKLSATYSGLYGVYDVTHSSWIIALSVAGKSTDWDILETTFVVPSGCTTVRLYFYCPSTSLAPWAGFDDVLLVRDSIDVKHNQMAANDVVYMEANGSVEFMRVLSGPTGAGPYKYYVDRDLDGSGLNDWYAGDALLNTGVTGDGYIDLYSVRSIRSGTHYGPSIVGNVRFGAIYNQLIEYWAIGNMNGIYGYGVDTYGAAFGRYANGSSFVTIDATNGIQFKKRASDITTVISSWAMNGTLTIGEVAASKTNIQISSGEMQFRVNTTVNMLLSTAGVITIGPSGSPQTVIDSTGIDFKVAGGGSLFFVDTTSEMIMCGLPRSVVINDSGVRVGGFTGFGSRVIVTDDLDGTGNGTLELSASRVSTGELYGLVYMPAIAGSAGYFNSLLLTANAATGGSGVKAEIDIYGAYNTNASYINMLLGTQSRFKIAATEIAANDDSNDVNFRVESNGNANMFIVDAGLDCVGIGGTPASGYELTLTGDMRYSGDLTSYKGSVAHLGYIFIPVVDAQWVWSSFNNTTYSSTSATVLDLNTENANHPHYARAVLVRVKVTETGSHGGGNWFIGFGPTSGLVSDVICRAYGGQPDYWEVTIPCVLNGSNHPEIYYYVVASGTNTMTIHIMTIGYFI